MEFGGVRRRQWLRNGGNDRKLSANDGGGWGGHKNITDGGVGGVIKILQIRGGEGIR